MKLEHCIITNIHLLMVTVCFLDHCELIFVIYLMSKFMEKYYLLLKQ